MIVHDDRGVPRLKSPVVTTGIFDGVHRGHRLLLDRVVNMAKETGGESAVVTFSPHPRLVLENNRKDLMFLSTLDEKRTLLETAGIDHLIVIEFTRELASMSACDFIGKTLSDKIGIKHLVIGYDHHFGRGAEGNYQTIKECSEKYGFTVEQLGKFESAALPVSSSAIRSLLLKGDIAGANTMLGYCYSVGGFVVEGQRLGRTIGFPTANIDPIDPHKLVPGKGVYAVRVELNTDHYLGMLSIGSNPTVNNDPLKLYIEVNIFDFKEDIYGKAIRVHFHEKIRDEMKFSSVDDLAAQIETDRQAVLKFFR